MARPASYSTAITTIAHELSGLPDGFSVGDILQRLPSPVSRQYVTRILQEMVKEKRLARSGVTRSTRYHAVTASTDTQPSWHKSFKLTGMSDYKILEEIYRDFTPIMGIKEDIRSIFSYAFTEMMNNAIDHSQSARAEVYVTLTEAMVRFTIRDFGVGVFRNVQAKYHLGNEFEAMEELLKGKTTTAPQAHSGEGIFFTSKIADVFSLRSFEYELRVDNRLPDIFAGKLETTVKGTEVAFEISLASTKHLNDIFKEYTNPTDLSFDKTHAYIKLYTTGTIYVSRSQAKRVLSGVQQRNFREIVLDFNQVPNIGQAFADEIFRVFAALHPNIKLTPINTNEAVNFMIKRVQPPKPQQPRLL